MKTFKVQTFFGQKFHFLKIMIFFKFLDETLKRAISIGLAQTQWICVDYIRRDCILKCSVYFFLFLEFSAEPISMKFVLHKTHYS